MLYVLQLRQDAAVSLQMIALDAHKRAVSINQQPSTQSAGAIPQLATSFYVDAVCGHQQLTGVVDVQQEVIIETTATTTAHSAAVQHQNVSC